MTWRAGARAPDFELLDGRGAKRVGGAEQDGALLVLEAAGELADGGGFARAVDPHHQDDGRRIGHMRGRPLAGLEDFEQVLADEPRQLDGVVHLVALDALADALQDLLGGAHSDIGGDEGEFELVEEVGVDLLLALDGVFEGVRPGRRGSSGRRS